MGVFFDRITRLVGRDMAEGLESCFGSDDVTMICIPLTDPMDEWVNGLFTKIVLSVENEADLLRVHELALEAGIPTALITDAGKTEFREVCSSCGGDGIPFGVKSGDLEPNDPWDEGGEKRVCGACNGGGKIGVPTHTAVAIGPAVAVEIDVITGPEGIVATKLA